MRPHFGRIFHGQGKNGFHCDEPVVFAGKREVAVGGRPAIFSDAEEPACGAEDRQFPQERSEGTAVGSGIHGYCSAESARHADQTFQAGESARGAPCKQSGHAQSRPGADQNALFPAGTEIRPDVFGGLSHAVQGTDDGKGQVPVIREQIAAAAEYPHVESFPFQQGREKIIVRRIFQPDFSQRKTSETQGGSSVNRKEGRAPADMNCHPLIHIRENAVPHW